jgi:hypothetical protein
VMSDKRNPLLYSRTQDFVYAWVHLQPFQEIEE